MWLEWERRVADTTKKRDRSFIGEGEVGSLIIAKLCESGKEKRYLGSIRMELLEDPFALVAFWREVQRRMNEYGLSNEEKWDIDKKLQKRVGKPAQAVADDIDYILANQYEFTRMPADVKKHSSVHVLAEIIRHVNDGVGFEVTIPYDSEHVKTYRVPSKAEGIQKMLDGFDVLLKGVTGEYREMFLRMYKDIEGKDYEPKSPPHES